MLKRLDAFCQCEGCGNHFGIEISLSHNMKAFDDFDSLAREEIRNGLNPGYRWGVRGKQTVDRMPLSYSVTIQADYMLCDVCSKKCDDVPVERNLTKLEVETTLGMPSDA
jgi:hypothetical protein